MGLWGDFQDVPTNKWTWQKLEQLCSRGRECTSKYFAFHFHSAQQESRIREIQKHDALACDVYHSSSKRQLLYWFYE